MSEIRSEMQHLKDLMGNYYWYMNFTFSISSSFKKDESLCTINLDDLVEYVYLNK